MFVSCVTTLCIFFSLCGCFNYSFNYVYRKGAAVLFEKENAVKRLYYLNDDEIKNFVSALRNERLELADAKGKTAAEKLLEGYVISLNQIYCQAQETDERKKLLQEECINEIISFSERINKFDELTVTEKNVFVDALLFEDYISLSLENLIRYKNTLCTAVEKVDDLSAKLSKIRREALKRKDNLNGEYAARVDGFLQSSMFTDEICGIEMIENKIAFLEGEYVSLIAYIDFMTQIKA